MNLIHRVLIFRVVLESILVPLSFAQQVADFLTTNLMLIHLMKFALTLEGEIVSGEQWKQLNEKPTYFRDEVVHLALVFPIQSNVGGRARCPSINADRAGNSRSKASVIGYFHQQVNLLYANFNRIIHETNCPLDDDQESFDGRIHVSLVFILWGGTPNPGR
jgi:hypothetical protein